MTLTHLTPEDYTTTRWSGGTTTELLIRPRGAAYAQRAFLCRVSSATVDLDSSTFTPLPDYHRLIATVEGEIDLIHDGDAPIHLKPFEVHAFDGGSETTSLGRCRDFNLMLRKGRATGNLRALTADGPCPLSPGVRTALLYCVSGACTAAGVPLAAGESLLLEDVGTNVLALEGTPQTRLMLAEVSYL